MDANFNQDNFSYYVSNQINFICRKKIFFESKLHDNKTKVNKFNRYMIDLENTYDIVKNKKDTLNLINNFKTWKDYNLYFDILTFSDQILKTLEIPDKLKKIIISQEYLTLKIEHQIQELGLLNHLISKYQNLEVIYILAKNN